MILTTNLLIVSVVVIFSQVIFVFFFAFGYGNVCL